MSKSKNPHVGGSFDDFLKEEGILEEVHNTAVKRVVAWQLEKAMKDQKLTKVEMARRMETSRAQLDRLLDPDNNSVTLETLNRAAAIIGRKVRLSLEENIPKQAIEPIHPGEILLEDFMKPLDISHNALAKAINVPARRISEIIQGTRAITADIALRLGRYFGVSAQSWMNLQSYYELEMANLEMGKRLEKEVHPRAA